MPKRVVFVFLQIKKSSHCFRLCHSLENINQLDGH